MNIMSRTDAQVFPVYQAAACGIAAGACGQFLASPTDLVKTQMQVCGRDGIWAAVRHIVSEGGLGGLARGLAVTVTREVPAFGIYFGSYDYIIRYLSLTRNT